MKKIILMLAILASVSNAQAAEPADQGLYAGAGFGVMQTIKDGDAGLGLSLRAGKQLDSVLKGLGIQLELNRSFADPETPSGRDIEATTFATYATFDIYIPDSEVTLRPKIGAILPNLRDDIDSRNLRLSSGFGMTYNIENNVRLFADYTILAEAINNYTVGLEIKF